MRITRVTWRNAVRVAVAGEDSVTVLPAGADVMDLLQASAEQRQESVAAAVDTDIALAEVELLAPLQPASIRDFVCFERHLEGMAMSTGDTVAAARQYEPTFYFSNPHAVFGAHEDIEVPPDCLQFDYELEVAAVIGRRGRDIRAQDAADYIVGFTIFNDWTARDVAQQARRNGLHAIKAKDSAITLGPWIVTADELEPYWRGDLLDLGLRVYRNGIEMGGDRLSNMGWTFGDLIAYSSRGSWIGPGDVIASGTCGGGCLAELWGRAGRVEPPPLEPGDVITMTVEGIGTIENRVVPGTGDPVSIPPLRRLRTPVGGSSGEVNL